jgi:hypothetical protein
MRERERRRPRLGGHRFVVVAGLAIVVVGCGSGPAPSLGPALPDPPSPVVTDEPSAAPASELLGAWRPTPIGLADSQVAIVSDACAATARATLGDDEADLPTAVVDARGGGSVIAILSDGGLGIDCFAHLTDAGAAVDAVDRLAISSVEPTGDGLVAVTELTVIDDAGRQRTVAYGRMEPTAASVRASFADGSTVTTTTGEGWWAAWWPDPKRPSAIDSLDSAGGVLASADAPGTEVESRLGPASWWLKPGAGASAGDGTTLPILVHEETCASGQSGADRLDPPTMSFDEATITVRLDIRRLAGAQDCQGNEPFPFTLELPEPVGGRRLLDGGSNPPRDATKPPAGS